MKTVNRFGRLEDVSILILSLLSLMSCTTMRPLDVNLGRDELTDSVSPGDVVRLTTRSGEQHVIRVSAITADEISGEDLVFELEDIEKIEVREPTIADKAADVGVVGAATVAVIAFYALIFAVVDYFVAAGL